MIPVTQTQLHSDQVKGNCLRAAIASILEIGIDSIPKFEEMGEDWFIEFRRWSRDSGYGMVSVYRSNIRPKGYSIASGESPRGIYHSVVAFDGEIVFDPHPSRAGLKEIDRYWVFEPLIRTLLLDKDGTLVTTLSGAEFVQNPEDQQLIPGVAETVREYAFNGWQIYVVSNQGGIDAGHKTVADVNAEMRHLMSLIPEISGCFYCPNDHEKWWHGIARGFGYSTRCIYVPRDSVNVITYYESDCDDEMVLFTGRSWGRPISYRKPSGLMLFLAILHSCSLTSDRWPGDVLMVGNGIEDENAAKSLRIPFCWAENFRSVGPQ